MPNASVFPDAPDGGGLTDGGGVTDGGGAATGGVATHQTILQQVLGELRSTNGRTRMRLSEVGDICADRRVALVDGGGAKLKLSVWASQQPGLHLWREESSWWVCEARFAPKPAPAPAPAPVVAAAVVRAAAAAVDPPSAAATAAAAGPTYTLVETPAALATAVAALEGAPFWALHVVPAATGGGAAALAVAASSADDGATPPASYVFHVGALGTAALRGDGAAAAAAAGGGLFGRGAFGRTLVVHDAAGVARALTRTFGVFPCLTRPPPDGMQSPRRPRLRPPQRRRSATRRPAPQHVATGVHLTAAVP